MLIPHVAHDDLTRVELRHTMRVMRFTGGSAGCPSWTSAVEITTSWTWVVSLAAIVPFMLREDTPANTNAVDKGSGADQGFHHGFAECYPPHRGAQR